MLRVVVYRLLGNADSRQTAPYYYLNIICSLRQYCTYTTHSINEGHFSSNPYTLLQLLVASEGESPAFAAIHQTPPRGNALPKQAILPFECRGEELQVSVSDETKRVTGNVFCYP